MGCYPGRGRPAKTQTLEPKTIDGVECEAADEDGQSAKQPLLVCV
jgi:hypothetical protein